MASYAQGQSLVSKDDDGEPFSLALPLRSPHGGWDDGWAECPACSLEAVPVEDACPVRGNREMDALTRIDNETVECARFGKRYRARFV